MNEHRKGRNCEQTDEVLEGYRRRALTAEQQLIAARQALRGRIVRNGDIRPMDPAVLARIEEDQWLLGLLSNGVESVVTYAAVHGTRGVLLDHA